MIKHSFIFLDKFGTRKEQALWQAGIKDWQDFLKNDLIKGISPAIKCHYDRQIKAAQQALLENNASYFIDKLPAMELWRLYEYFKEEAGYLDVEVDSYGRIIVVGISDYYHSNFFVKGVNLEKSLLEKELKKFKLLITFNGASFDLPKLRKQLDVAIKIPHLDLKPLCVKLGWTGGLKEVELKLNLKRPAHLNGNPVSLWKAFHASGDREYLELLLDYNREDIENLKAVMEQAQQRLTKDLYSRMHLGCT